ncbi:MAG TPA: hypothetical protein VF599_17855 [Pyrinomonadaceae bacterium]|jgi:hypothetical protein
MAFIDEDSADPIAYADFYNVNQAVGMGCPNWSEDVMVVQFFLQKIYEHADWKPFQPKGAMKVDGKCDPVTRSWILKFQSDARDSGTNLYPDGIVNKAGNAVSNQKAAITGTTYTIRSMNNFLRHNQKPLYSTLPVNPAVPPLLRLAFLQMHAEKPDADFNF